MYNSAQSIYFSFLIFILIGMTGCVNEVLKGELDTSRTKSVSLEQELANARDHVAHQDQQNEELLRRQSLLQQELEKLRIDYAQEQKEWKNENGRLLSQIGQLEKKNLETNRILESQNVSFRKSPSITIIPNNSALLKEPQLPEPNRFPLRRQGENLVLELPDAFLFEIAPESGHFVLSKKGKERLTRLGRELLRCYPNNIFCLEGHCDPSRVSISTGEPLRNPTMEKVHIVASFLIHEVGFSRKQMELADCGAARPTVRSDSLLERQKNQRLELVIRPDLQL